MTVFATYLWKEWRDQRATLAWLVGGLLVLTVAAVLFLPVEAARDPFVTLTIGIGAAVVGHLFTVGSDLLPGDLARRRVRFLERVPGGLRSALISKLIFFSGSLLTAALFGALLGTIVLALRPEEASSRLFDGDYLPWFATVLALCAWTFTVSAWVPRGALALPTGLLALAAFSWPMWFFRDEAPWYRPGLDEVYTYTALSSLAVPFLAWISYVRGYRFGRPQGRAAAAGFITAVLLFVPAWGWTESRVHHAWTIDPRAEDWLIQGASVGENSRYAFLDAQRRAPHGQGKRQRDLPHHALVVDLESGAWRSEGYGRWSSADPETRIEFPRNGYLPFVWLVPAEIGERSVVFDANTGERLGRQPQLDERRPLPTATELGLDAGLIIRYTAGLGYEVHRVHRRGSARLELEGYYDPFREAFFPGEAITGDGFREWDREVLVRLGRWLIKARRGEPWSLFDPDTGRSTPVPSLGPEERIMGTVADGRVFLSSAGRVFLFGPEDGTREEVHFSDGRSRRLTYLLRLPDHHASDPMYRIRVADRYAWGFARFDLRERVLHATSRDWRPGFPSYLAYVDDDAILALHDQSSIVRLPLDGSAPEVLFPRPESVERKLP